MSDTNFTSLDVDTLKIGSVAITSTPAELNKLDGTSAVLADFEKLHDVTATSAELNALHIIEETAAYDDFTDGAGTSGTFALTDKIPAGATVLYAAVTAVTGFTGDTSAVMTIGDGTDPDRYNTGTINVFANAANGVSAGAPSGTVYHNAEKTVTLTVTSAADFTSVNAGSVTVKLYYLL